MMYHSGFVNRCSCRRYASTRALVDGVLSQRRDSLAKAITLIESSRSDHRRQAQDLLKSLSRPSTFSRSNFNLNKSLRLGIAGPPGAGKSSFIESFGLQLIQKSHKLAVIPVDPSSHITGGSILGDKTRMEKLTREPNAYIRGSPTRCVLGGIAEHTADVISLCESAGYDVVIIESVGLGQSEVAIDRAVDMLVVILPPGSGDGLQASKKGIMEAADLVLVNKADGHLLEAAKHTKADYSSAMQFIRPKSDAWQPTVQLMSAVTGAGLDMIESEIRRFHTVMCENGQLDKKRSIQALAWMWDKMHRRILDRVDSDETVARLAVSLSDQVAGGTISAHEAAERLELAFVASMKEPCQS